MAHDNGNAGYLELKAEDVIRLKATDELTKRLEGMKGVKIIAGPKLGIGTVPPPHKLEVDFEKVAVTEAEEPEEEKPTTKRTHGNCAFFVNDEEGPEGDCFWMKEEGKPHRFDGRNAACENWGARAARNCFSQKDPIARRL